MLEQDLSRRDVTVDIITEVASREGVSPTGLPPLSQSIGPDALNSLVQSQEYDTVSISFTYCGYDVTVDSSGVITVHT